MKKLLLLTIFSAALHAEATAVTIVNINSALVALLQSAAGFNTTQPYAEVLILHPSAAADGYRVHVTYYDSNGVKHEVTRDVVCQTTSDDRPLLELFWIDAAGISATATPYRLQPGSISAP